jgi:hypothetical protein
MYCAGIDDEHAAPHETVVPPATVIAADSVIVVVPLNAATVVPGVIPMPEIKAPTIGGVAGVEVNVSVVDEPEVLPTPEPWDVKIDALPAITRTLTGPLPRSATAFAAIGKVTAFCASAENAVQPSTNRTADSFFIIFIAQSIPQRRL